MAIHINNFESVYQFNMPGVDGGDVNLRVKWMVQWLKGEEKI